MDPVVYSFDTSQPIQAGQFIGMSVDGGHSFAQYTTVNGDAIRYVAPDPANGSPQAFFDPLPMHLLALNAKISFCRVPKVVGKKLGKAKKAVKRAGCKPKAISKPSNKPARTVFKQKPKPGKGIAPGGTVKVFWAENG